MFLCMYIGVIFDLYVCIREEIPLGFLFDSEGYVRENWVDNPEPALFTILFRIFSHLFFYFGCTHLIFHFRGFDQRKQDEILNLPEFQLARLFLFLNLSLYVTHYTVKFLKMRHA